MYVPITTVEQPARRFSTDFLATIVGARLTENDQLEYATRSVPLGGPGRTLEDGLGRLRVHGPGQEVWETSRHMLARHIGSFRLNVDVAEMIYPLAARDDQSRVEHAARRATVIDHQIETWIADDAKWHGEVRIGSQWINATPGRDRPPYVVLPDGTSSDTAADALQARLEALEDVARIERTAIATVTPQDMPGESGTLVERWTVCLQDWDQPTITVRGAELWAYGDGEIGLRCRHVAGLQLERKQ